MSKAELELLDLHVALTKKRLRDALRESGHELRSTIDPSPWIRAHPEGSVWTTFAIACFAGRRLRRRAPRTPRPEVREARSDGKSRATATRTPWRAARVVMRFARMSVRQWLVDRLLDVWNDNRDVGRPRSPRVA